MAEVEQLCGAYKALADHSAQEKARRRRLDAEGAKASRASKFPLSIVRGFLRGSLKTPVALPTLHLPVAKVCDYTNAISLVKFDSQAQVIFSGINQPYLVRAVGSDGKQCVLRQ